MTDQSTRANKKRLVLYLKNQQTLILAMQVGSEKNDLMRLLPEKEVAVYLRELKRVELSIRSLRESIGDLKAYR